MPFHCGEELILEFDGLEMVRKVPEFFTTSDL
jgi:hypothetical protein